MVRALDRKLLRELGGMRGQALAIIALVAAGAAVLVGTASTHRSLQASRSRYYEGQLFADLFAPLRRAPASIVAQIRALPGVADAEGRVVAQAPLEVAGFTEPVTGKLVSLPDAGAARLNRVVLRSGRMPTAGADDEVLVSEGFVIAHHLRAGDHLRAVVNGRWRQFVIVGIALSPEYIFPIRPGDPMPDDRHFGVLWTGERGLAAAMRMTGAVNDISVRLAAGASERAVLAELDDVLARYGGLGAFGRNEHDSHRFLSDEIRQLRNESTVLPPIFFGVAAFLLGIVLSRLVAIQRTEIGTLKALGYSNAAVGVHFAKLAFLLVAGGVAAGTALGSWMGHQLTQLYGQFYRLPVLEFSLYPVVVLQAVVASIVTASAGVAGSVARAVRLDPAAAMKPEAPADYRAGWLERLGVTRRLSPSWRMIVRHISRRLRRTALSCAGIAASLAIVMAGLSFNDAMDWMMDVQFNAAQREDAAVLFNDPLPPETVQELRRLPGIRAAEPFRAVRVRLRAGHRDRRMAVMALEAEPRLHRIVGGERSVVQPPLRGLMLSSVLARLLEVRPGDQVTVQVLEGRRQTLQLPVSALVDDWLDANAYIDRSALTSLLGDGGPISGAFLQLDAARESAVYRQLRAMPRVAGVTLKRSALQMFRDTSAQFVLVFTGVLVFFALMITAGVLYNAGRVSFAERQRELATLRVLGFTRRETWMVIAGEHMLQVCAAVPLGILVGVAFIHFAVRMMESDLFRIPVVVAPGTVVFSTGVVVVAAVLVSLLLWRWIRQLDLIAVLKTRE